MYTEHFKAFATNFYTQLWLQY